MHKKSLATCPFICTFLLRIRSIQNTLQKVLEESIYFKLLCNISLCFSALLYSLSPFRVFPKYLMTFSEFHSRQKNIWIIVVMKTRNKNSWTVLYSDIVKVKIRLTNTITSRNTIVGNTVKHNLALSSTHVNLPKRKPQTYQKAT